MRPVHQTCPEKERLLIARVRILIIRQTDPKRLLSFRVDEVFCRIARNRQEKFVAHVECVTYGDLASALPALRTVVYQRPNSSQTQIYRVKFVDRPQYPARQLTSLRDADEPNFPPLEWRVFRETSSEP